MQGIKAQFEQGQAIGTCPQGGSRNTVSERMLVLGQRILSLNASLAGILEALGVPVPEQEEIGKGTESGSVAHRYNEAVSIMEKLVLSCGVKAEHIRGEIERL